MCIYNQNAKVAAREILILGIKAHDAIPSLSWILALTLATVSLLSTSSATVFPVRVFTKICIFAKRRLELGHFACRKRRIRVFWTPGGETFWVVVYIGRGLQGLTRPLQNLVCVQEGTMLARSWRPSFRETGTFCAAMLY